MARYRKIDVRMWHVDEKFRALSKPQPNAQSLWIYLVSGPMPWSIPGLYSIGEAALAEAMGWPLEGLRKAYQELFEKGMAKADWKYRVVWIPKAIKYNEPENPNVIKHWAKNFDEVPECDLKKEAFDCISIHLKGLPKGFQEAFAEVFPKGYSKSVAVAVSVTETNKIIAVTRSIPTSNNKGNGNEIKTPEDDLLDRLIEFTDSPQSRSFYQGKIRALGTGLVAEAMGEVRMREAEGGVHNRAKYLTALLNDWDKRN